MVVCLVSRLIQGKGVAEYLEAARILCRTHGSGLIFLLVGDYDDGNPKPLSRTLLNEYIAEGTITYLGFRDDIQELLKAVDVYCLPSYREGMPMSILEAMATGLPIVTSDAVGCRDTRGRWHKWSQIPGEGYSSSLPGLRACFGIHL